MNHSSKSKNNRGFTLLELIASIGILAIILLIATVSYTQIRKRILSSQYNNLKVLIEGTGVKYASQNGYKAFFVQDLIDSGMLETDDETDVYDPRDHSSLNCHVVEINEDDYGNFHGDLKDRDYSAPSGSSQRCETKGFEQFNGFITLSAVLNGTTISYPGSGIVNPNNKVFPDIYDGWTKSQLRFTATLKNNIPNDDRTGGKFVWNNDPNIVTNYPNNTYLTTYPTDKPYINNDDFYVTFYTNKDESYVAKMRVKYDNEAPIIYQDKTKFANSTSNNDWTKSKTLIVYATDKDGVGLDRIYVGSSSCSTMLTNKNLGQAASPGMIQIVNIYENLDETGKELNICAVDKLGNLTNGGKVTVARIDRTAPDVSTAVYIYDASIDSNIANYTNKLPDINGNVDLVNQNIDILDYHPDTSGWTNTGHTYIFSVTDNSNVGLKDTAYWQYNSSRSDYATYAVYDHATNLGKNTTLSTSDKYVFKVSFPTVGKRLGKIRICDKLENCRTILVKNDNIDKTAPNVIISAYLYDADKALNYSQYTGITASSGYITAASQNASLNITSRWVNSGSVFKFTLSDPGSGVSYRYVDHNATGIYNATDENYTENNGRKDLTSAGGIDGARTTAGGRRKFKYTLCDKVGNCRVVYFGEYLDTIKPTCTLATTTNPNDNGWFKANFKIQMTKSDNESGAEHFYISTSSSPNFAGNDDYSAPHTVTTETANGGRTYYGHVIDKAGNVNKCNTTVFLDKTAPNIKLHVFDYSSTLGSQWQSYTSETSHLYYSGDNVSYTVSGWTNSPRVFRFQLKDEASGLNYRYLNYNENGHYRDISDNYTTDKNRKAFNVNPSSYYYDGYRFANGGRRRGKYQVCDKADNCREITIGDDIDMIPPVCTPTTKIHGTSTTYTTAYVNSPNYVNKSVDFYANCVDNENELNSVQYLNNRNPSSATINQITYKGSLNGIYTLTNDGVYGFGVRATDLAGNETKIICANCGAEPTSSDWNNNTIAIDKTPPTAKMYVYQYNSSFGGNSATYMNEGVLIKSKTLTTSDNTLSVGKNGTGVAIVTNYTDSRSGIATRSKYINAPGDFTSYNTNYTLSGSATYNAASSARIITQLPKPGSNGKRIVKEDICDTAGNCITTFGKVEVGDVPLPTCSISITSGTKANKDSDGRQWYKSNVSLKMTYSGQNVTNYVLIANGLINDDPNSQYYIGKYSNTTTATLNQDSTTAGIVYYGYVKNDSGIGTCQFTVYRDTTAPTCNYIQGCSSSWKKGYCENSVTCTDNQSGCNVYYANQNKGFELRLPYGVADGVTYSADLTYHDIEGVKVVDNAGHETACTHRFNVYIDNTRPTCAPTARHSTASNPTLNGAIYATSPLSSPRWTNTNIIFDHNCTDNLSGLKSVSWTDGYSTATTLVPGTLTYVNIDNVTNGFNGLTGMGVTATDKAGNSTQSAICAYGESGHCSQNPSGTEWNNHVIAIDRIPPTLGAFSSDGKAVNTSHDKGTILTFTCTDIHSGRYDDGSNHGTGISCDGVGCGYTVGGDWNYLYLNTNNLSAGTHVISHSCMDKAGNNTAVNYQITVNQTQTSSPPVNTGQPAGGCNEPCEFGGTQSSTVQCSKPDKNGNYNHHGYEFCNRRYVFGCVAEVLDSEIWVQNKDTFKDLVNGWTYTNGITSAATGHYSQYKCMQSFTSTGWYFCSASGSAYRYSIAGQTSTHSSGRVGYKVTIYRCSKYADGGEYDNWLGGNTESHNFCCK